MFDIVMPIEGRSVPGRRLLVSHTATDLPRGLEMDEHVVLRDADLDRCYLARVVEVEFTATDTWYTLHVDGAIGPDVANRYASSNTRVQTQQVAQLLDELARRRIIA